MPANQKNFEQINRAKYQSFRQSLRENAWIPPYGDSGYVRGSDGLLADLAYDEKTEAIAMRVRSVPKGQTYGSFFDRIETILKGITT